MGYDFPPPEMSTYSSVMQKQYTWPLAMSYSAAECHVSIHTGVPKGDHYTSVPKGDHYRMCKITKEPQTTVG